MKILHVIPSLERGGAEQALVNLLPALATRGHVCEVATLGPVEPLGPILEAHGIAVRRIDKGHRWNLPLNVRRLRALVRVGGYDAVHAHLFFPALYVALGGGGAAGRVVSFHNMDYDHHPADTPWRRARKRLHAFALRGGVDRFVAVSGPVAAHFERHLGLSGVRTIPNAFPVNLLRSIAARASFKLLKTYGLPESTFTIVNPGRMVRQKGHMTLLAALSQLADGGREFQAWIVGSGPEAESVRAEIVERGLSDRVTHIEAIAHDDLMGVVAQADAFAMSSWHEGLGLVAGEAMAVGTPVVSTAAGGVVDLVRDGETGLLVTPGDAAALAEALGRLMDDANLRKRLVQAAGRHLEMEFSAGSVAERLEAVYDQARQTRQHDGASSRLIEEGTDVI